MTATETLRDTLEALVREHLESENRHEFDVTIATFEHPRYELIASGEVFDGQEEVAEYFARTRGAFPDQRNEMISMRHADDAVIVELNLLGTPLGELYGVPATGCFSSRTTAWSASACPSTSPRS